jgi:hypothetical protein
VARFLLQRDPDVRGLAAEVAQDARHQRGRHRVHEREPDRPRLRVEQRRQVLAQLLVPPGDVPGGGEHHLAVGIGARAGRVPLEEPGPELVLHPGEQPGQRRLARLQRLGRVRDPLVFGEDEQSPQLLNVHKL